MNNKTKIITNKYLIDAQTGKAYQGRKDIIGENLKKQSNTTVRSNKSVKPILPYAKGYTPVDVPKVKTPDSKLSPVMRNKTEQFAKELSVFSPAQINDYKNASSWLSDNAKKDAIVWQKNQGWTYGGNPEYEIQPSKDYEYMLDAPDGVYDHMLGEKKYRDAFFSPDGKYISTLPHVHEKYYNLKVSQMSDDEIDKNV